MIPAATRPISATLVFNEPGQPVIQYSLEDVKVDVSTGRHSGSDRLEVSGRMAGEHFVDLAPKVKTVADLNLGMLHTTRVRVTTEEGVHEGVLRDITTETETTDLGNRKAYHTYIELGIGNACIPVETTDLAEVIEEEKA